MRDFNFFEPYLKKSEKKASLGKGILIGALTVSLVVVGASTYQYITINNLKKEIASQDSYLNSREIREKTKEIEDSKKKIKLMEEYRSELSDIRSEMKKTDIIGSYLVDQINSSMPQDLFLETLRLEDNEIEVSGISRQRTSIAELQHNLEQLKEFKGVYVKEIGLEDESSTNFRFSLSCKIKDVEQP